MENKNEIVEQIERYVFGEMNLSERKDFETRMLSDSDFAEEVADYKKLINSFDGYVKRSKIKKRLEIAHVEMQSEVEVSSLRPLKIRNLFVGRKVWAAAASVALLISIGTYLVMYYVHSFNYKDKAYYKELRLDIEQVKSSQKKIIKKLNEDKASQREASFGGTAIAISAEGYVLSSYHVVKDVETIYMENKRFNRLKLKKVYSDPKLDLIILKVEDDSFKTFGPLPFTFRKTNLDLGEQVFTLGYPKQDVVFGEGYISSVNGYDGDTVSYQIAVPVNPGQSGGPLFDQQGNLVGIVSGKHTENEGSAFAVKAYYIKKTIVSNDSLSISIKLPKVNYLRNQGKIQMIKKMQDYVFEIKGYTKY
ncbi:MAG TPA: serine protease [Cytophagaceae bacterium]|jgi:serine protease Do|nr:serine protease [Cytophagaceae bacterium]